MPTIYEQMQEGNNSYDGVTLSYHGARFVDSSFVNNAYNADDSSLTPLEAFTERFKNIGALLIRFHLGQGQRGGLLQQLTRINYAENPIERPAKGGDDSAVFFKEDAQSTENILEFLSHQPLGRSKVLNERAQPLLHVNKAHVYGEQGLWDILHAPVWNVGRAMKYELKKQGFIYLACPSGMSSKDRAFLDLRLTTSGMPFKNVFDEQGLSAITGEISKLSYCLDDEKKYTQEENGLAIGLDTDYAPLGWIVHAETGEILPQGITEEIIRVSAIAEGGFYEKRKTQQQILQSGYLKNTNGLGLFMQNQAFNAMYVIFDYLQKYSFDPRPLLDGSLLAMSKRVGELMKKDPSVIDDFLTGALQDEMVQPLRVSQAKSKRTVLPLRFTNPFEVTINNLKGIAYAFDLKDSNGQPIFREYDDSPIISQAKELTDAKVNGVLVAPSFSTGGHVAAILSTAELVAEQMILEQLLPDAFVAKDVSESILSQLLVKCLDQQKGKEVLNELLEEAAEVPRADNKPVCGIQFEYCNKLVQLLRQSLGFNQLQSVLAQFAKPGISTQEVLESMTQDELLKFSAALKVLYITGSMLQKSPLTSAQSEHSRGINAGLEPLIAALNPHLAQELEIASESIERAVVSSIDKGVVKDRLSTQIFTQCPFLSGQLKKQKEVVSEANAEHVGTSQNTGYSFFNTMWNNKGTILTATVSAAVVVGGIMLNQ
ncbi:MAG: hypothetical protein P4L79_04415 [Legionella sp.]|uniref:Dot/Icm T4SS effector Ceg17 n=1 Tax=Legionella sp. TaxID=459 RepID=UPI002845714E|nr:hypothetical protein [Legionella sp.]